MKYFIAVGIADARKQVRVSEHSLKRVVALEEPRSELIEGGTFKLQAPGLMRLQGLSALYYMQRSTLLRARLGQKQ